MTRETMTVIVDGKEEQREIDYINRDCDNFIGDKGEPTIVDNFPVPKLYDGEIFIRAAGGEVLIVKGLS